MAGFSRSEPAPRAPAVREAPSRVLGMKLWVQCPRCANTQGHEGVTLDSQAFQASSSPQIQVPIPGLLSPTWGQPAFLAGSLKMHPWPRSLLCGFPFPGSLLLLPPQPETCSTALICGRVCQCVHTNVQWSPTCLEALLTSSFPSWFRGALTPSPFSVIGLGPQPVSQAGCFTVIFPCTAPVISALQMGKLRHGLGRSHLPPARKQEM